MGEFFLNKNIAIIGGGNAGFEAAIFLSKIAKKIYILESSSKISADQNNQEIIKKIEKIEIITAVIIVFLKLSLN